MIFIPQLISLDYDHTFTADPDLWVSFIKAAELRGHRVIMVTWRSGRDPVTGTRDSRSVLHQYGT